MNVDLNQLFFPVCSLPRSCRFYLLSVLSYYGLNNPPPTPELLTREKEEEIFLRYFKRKSAKDREILVRQYLCWAFGLAAKMKGPRLPFDEAISAANAGLLEALETFNPKLGFRFTTYAAWTLRRKIIEALIATYPIHVPDHLRKKWKKLSLLSGKAVKPMLKDSEDPRDAEEFFERLGENSDVDIAQMHERPEDAPFVPIPGDDPVETANAAGEGSAMRKALKWLFPEERAIIKAKHYTEPPESFVSIAKRLKISKSTARETYDVALMKLRRHFKKDKL